MERFDTFDVVEREKPWKKICMSIVLTAIGISLFAGGMVLLTNQGNNNGSALIVLGVLLLIPGCYNVFVAYKACRGERGYTFEGIPEVV